MKLIALLFSSLTVLALLGSWGMNRGIAGLIAIPGGEAVVRHEVSVSAEPQQGTRVSNLTRPSRGPSKRDYVQGIIARNIFDHTAVGKVAEVREDGEYAISDLDVEIVATVVAHPARYSSALLTFSGATQGYGVGDRLADAEIIEIHKMRILVKRSDGSIEVIEAGDEKPKPKTASTSSGSSGNSDEGIEQVSETEFNVDRELVDKYMNDLAAVQQLGRARIHRTDGEVDGYRLAGIRRDSMGWKLGIRNGDVIHSVNGSSLSSMGEAMTAFQTLQSESSFSFEVTRKGQPTKLQYNVR
ncbi:MAG: hypothetical protein JXX28_10245 [Deltaproteobacteria bacterium]|nr:hypothetical protein [Deltaproteobacteria bacterium]